MSILNHIQSSGIPQPPLSSGQHNKHSITKPMIHMVPASLAISSIKPIVKQNEARTTNFLPKNLSVKPTCVVIKHKGDSDMEEELNISQISERTESNELNDKEEIKEFDSSNPKLNKEYEPTTEDLEESNGSKDTKEIEADDGDRHKEKTEIGVHEKESSISIGNPLLKKSTCEKRNKKKKPPIPKNLSGKESQKVININSKNISNSIIDRTINIKSNQYQKNDTKPKNLSLSSESESVLIPSRHSSFSYTPSVVNLKLASQFETDAKLAMSLALASKCIKQSTTKITPKNTDCQKIKYGSKQKRLSVKSFPSAKVPS